MCLVIRAVHKFATRPKLFQSIVPKVKNMILSCLKKIHGISAAALVDMRTSAIKAYKKHTQKFVFLIKNQKGRVSNRNSAQRTKPFPAQEFQAKMSFGVARFLGSPKTSFAVNTRITEKHGISWQLSSILEGQKNGQTFRKDV